MSETRQALSRPILTSVAPQLFVADIKASCEFFTAKLGFVVDFTYGDPPFYGQVTRDNARFVLKQTDKPVFREIREREHLLSAAITVASADEIKQLFLSYQSEGVRFHQPLKTESWGATNFIVQDLDENLILFAGPAPQS
jgi:predicted lactoylglutathione lyase